MKKIDFKEVEIKAHNILFASTSEQDYEMSRVILLSGPSYSEFIVVEGSHCSYYDFDETEWSAIKYTEEELKKLAETWEKSEWSVEERELGKFIKRYFLI